MTAVTVELAVAAVAPASAVAGIELDRNVPAETPLLFPVAAAAAAAAAPVSGR